MNNHPVWYVECKDSVAHRHYQGVFVTKELAEKAVIYFLIEGSTIQGRYFIDVIEVIKHGRFDKAIELALKRPSISISTIELELKYSLQYPVINSS